MAKVDVDLVKMVMTRTGLDVRTVAQVIEEINLELKAQADEEEKPPPVKKQFVMMVSDPEGKLEGVDLVGWVLQIPEEDSVYVTEERLFRCAYEYNMSKKGRRMPVKTIAEVCEHAPARIAKEQKVWIKNKEPVLLLRTNNKVPMETKDAGF
ncbi:hypothetical protein [Cerasicoccus fimbriatus]|uniref:hypothetical protein n=1 Tax=Cerasicoccus fimbriatus TaxID=3014554 RepID=UPI0022B3B70B|nr:hypothetical protein [Cerasicoccus sp. TK19100]